MNEIPQPVTILGSTGSIGQSTLDVIRRHRDKYAVYGLTAKSSVDDMFAQCVEFTPEIAVMRDEESAVALATRLKQAGSRTRVAGGLQALIEVAGSDDSRIVMAAIVGGAGLAPTLAAAVAGKRILLANKEALVMSGALFMQALEKSGAVLLPIDSEHNAIYQCLANGSQEHARGIRRVWLTASGGPLLRTPVDELGRVTPDEACAHPNWKMGRKISIDSATMMNKGLELIEACWLFGVPKTQIEIVIHPQSIVHSMVEYIDGSTVAQLGNPDMRTPIAHGLSWPDRITSGVNGLDPVEAGRLDFEAVDYARFPCLGLARQVAGTTQSASIVLNAGNEVAVQAFLDELIRFTDIPLVIESVLERTGSHEVRTIEDVFALDAEAREYSREALKRFGGAA
ncbi:MAG: 1-deoxy-D-xylulose-5-phosphate reductoisomerase [Pseudomonadales bacterium]